jgi:glutamate synthase (NADPH/NADH) small chain
MDCGIPFCHSACPLEIYLTLIWYIKKWQGALEILQATNNFTGRMPCSM